MEVDERTPERLRELMASPPHLKPDGQDYYGIGIVAKHLNLSVHTLRWYERIGLLGDIARDERGQRRFRNSDVEWLHFINRMRLTGMPITDMVEYANLLRQGDTTIPQRQNLLEAHRQNLIASVERLQSTLAIVTYKIELCQQQFAAKDRI
ncbi:MerR family transcriptional regulator [Natronoglycomyces albus]|uniref:MerR family transcriptional regulator n=1 Tax=Natronoglycomyces albus TaxID=2811108 RepID=A0A895XZ30_9ACTN|nr:MerR family transcriptional regulator [Natronoglycomyces albus]QSB06858.1 MerR family transcriptional regulator [Natronoglycomyces albus]